MSTDAEKHSSPLAFEYDEYYTLPKEIGSVPARELLQIAKYNAYRAESVNNSASCRFDAVAGSAYIEAVLVGGQDDADLEERLENLNKAQRHLELVVDVERNRLETGSVHFDKQDDWQYAKMKLDFMDVYRDIACGEITLLTKHEIIGRLEKRVEYNKWLATQGTKEYRKSNRGVANEANVLLNSWRGYHTKDNPVAIPSTERGGHGVFNPDETHDICLATQGEHGWSFETREIKGHVSNENLVRYKSSIIQVDHDGNMRTIDEMAA
jgi:hypothetical protein